MTSDSARCFIRICLSCPCIHSRSRFHKLTLLEAPRVRLDRVSPRRPNRLTQSLRSGPSPASRRGGGRGAAARYPAKCQYTGAARPGVPPKRTGFECPLSRRLRNACQGGGEGLRAGYPTSATVNTRRRRVADERMLVTSLGLRGSASARALGGALGLGHSLVAPNSAHAGSCWWRPVQVAVGGAHG